MIRNGTQPRKKDHRKYSFARTFGTIAVGEIPDFNLDAGFGMPDQNADGLPMGCTGYTTTELAQDQDKVKYLPRYTYDKTLQIEGINPDDPQFERVGCAIDDSLKSSKVYGLDAGDGDPLKHRRGDYFDALDGSGKDVFDTLLSLMWNANKSISIATPWLPEWSTPQNGVIPSVFTYDKSKQYSWHNWKICGKKTINGVQYLMGKVWQGEGLGDRGWLYFSRDVINKTLSIKGTSADVVVPFTPSKIRTVSLSIIEVILSYFRLWFKVKASPTIAPEAPVVAQDETLAVSEPKSTKYDWDVPIMARHSVRVICDEEGLTLEQKNTLCATIGAESGWKIDAVNQNKVKGKVVSTDYGLCQWNDFYHGKEITPDEALHDPEKAVRLMCACWKRGQRDLWIGYKSGNYKNYL